MSITYIAFDTRIELIRSIKEFFPRGCVRTPQMIVSPGSMGQDGFDSALQRFTAREAFMVRLSEKPLANIIPVCDRIDALGTVYYVMDYVEGCTMEAYLKKNRAGLAWREARRIMGEALTAISQVSDQVYLGLDNLFRLRNGSIRLINLMSAEQYGDSLHALQGVDVLSAGLCMYALVTGEMPEYMPGKKLPELRQQGYDVPKAYDDVIRKATHPSPGKRYPSIQAMLDDVRSVDEEKEPVSRRVWLIPVMAVLLIAVVWYGFSLRGEDERTEDVPEIAGSWEKGSLEEKRLELDPMSAFRRLNKIEARRSAQNVSYSVDITTTDDVKSISIVVTDSHGEVLSDQRILPQRSTEAVWNKRWKAMAGLSIQDQDATVELVYFMKDRERQREPLPID